jgi:hypothetical protein
LAFRIRVITPPVVDEEGWPHAGGEFTLGAGRLIFLVDLSHWGVADYQRQWQAALDRMARGTPATALLTAYRGPGDTPHRGWALWREDSWIYIQKQSFLPSESVEPFDPQNLDANLGPRLRATEHGLPIPEWRTELVQLLATAFRIRLPQFPS